LRKWKKVSWSGCWKWVKIICYKRKIISKKGVGLQCIVDHN